MGILRSRPTGVCPRLLYNLGKDNVSSRPSPGFLHGKKVLSCSHGWLVLFDNTKKKNCLSLCNSTTFDDHDTIPLPSLDLIFSGPDCKIDSCILISSSSGSSDPNNNSTFSLKVLLFLENVQSIMWCRVGDDVWGEIKYGKQLESHIGSSTCSYFSRAVSFGSTIYAVLWDDANGGFEIDSMYSIKIVEEPCFGIGNMSTLNCISRPSDYGDFRHLHSVCLVDSYMLESCGELFWVRFEWGDIRSVETLMVEVWKYSIESDDITWYRVRTLKDRAFFLGDHYCFSCHASGCAGNIYFSTPTISKDERSIYCYNIEDKSVVIISTDQYSSQESNNGPKEEEEEEEEDYYKKQMLELLVDDVLEEITKHFTPLDYMDFRSVSRRFQSVSPLANWTRPALSRSLKTSHTFPLLMFGVDTKNWIYKLVDSRLNSSIYYMMTIPNSGCSLIDYSKHGWLLTTRMNWEVKLYNPFTKNLIRFLYTNPRASPVHDSFFFVMKPPMPSQTCRDHTNFLVVAVSFIERTRIFVSTIHPGETNWVLHELHSNRSFSAAHTSPVLLHDSFYYMDCSGNIGKLKIEEEEEEGGKYMMSWQVLDKPRKPCKSFHPNFLVECGGKLLSVCIEYGGTSVLVCKFNEAEMAWEAMMSLGNYTLYLSRSSSFSLPVAKSCELRNRIYFPSFRGSEIVFFSLDTSKWHFSGSGDSSRHVYGTRYHLDSCWIQPNWC